MRLEAAIVCALAALGPGAASAQSAAADPSSAGVEALRQEVHALEQKVQAMDRGPVNASLGPGGLKLASPDGEFSMHVGGYMQLDSRSFVRNAKQGVDGFLLRRAHPIVAGTVARDFSYKFMAEFAGASPSLFDAYVRYHPLAQLQLWAGRFKMPLGLEWLRAAANLPLNERSLVNDIVPHRSLGLELSGSLSGGRASYAAGVYNSVADGSDAKNSGFDNDEEIMGRLFLQPFKNTSAKALGGLGLGVGGSVGPQFGTSAVPAGYKSDGQQTFFAYAGGAEGDGAHWRLSPQGYYFWRSLEVLGEYAVSDQRVANGTAAARLRNRAWQATAGWVLTGEDAAFSGVTPRHPFRFRGGGWGAWELVGRVEGLRVDDAAFPIFADPATSASAARAWSAGLDWWLNTNVRVLSSFSRTTFTGGASGAVTKRPEEVVFTRLQLSL